MLITVSGCDIETGDGGSAGVWVRNMMGVILDAGMCVRDVGVWGCSIHD